MSQSRGASRIRQELSMRIGKLTISFLYLRSESKRNTLEQMNIALNINRTRHISLFVCIYRLMQNAQLLIHDENIKGS